MPSTGFRIESQDGVEIAAYQWTPDGDPRGIVQLTHGMGEHAQRYEPLATALTAHGFVVVAQDHRGHGASAASPAEYGNLGPGGWGALVDDIGRLAARARAEHPGLRLVLVAHSMGSFAAQQFALDHSREITALALSGTAVLDLLEPTLDLDQPLELAMFNAPFVPARTDFDWLSRDDAQVDLYIADPRCGFGLEGAASKAMFVGARPMADAARIAAMRADLPVYITAGAEDPVHGQLTLLSPLVERYTAHLSDVTVQIYPGARHEVFNEVNRDEVFADLITWLNRIVAAD